MIETKDRYKNLHESIEELIKDGVPGIVGMEFSRRILEERIKDAKEFKVDVR